MDQVALFIAFLHAQEYAPSSISSYVSALGYIHRLQNMPDPTEVFVVKRMLRSVHKMGRKRDSRLPITESILNKLVLSLPFITKSYYDKIMFRSMFLLAFYAFLRIGEITVQLKQAENTIQFENVKIFSKNGSFTKMEIIMYHYKWQRSGRPTTLVIQPNMGNSDLCPVRALFNYLALRGKSPGPLFCYPPNKGISETYFNLTLRKAIEHAGYDSKLYKSHSFRIGAATKAASLGYTEIQIQQMGRWKSNSAYKKYVRITLTNCM